MRRLGAFYRRLLGLVRRRRLEQDLDDELAFHLAMREADHREAGLSPDSAHVAARRQFGSVTLLKEQAREAWTFPSFESWWQDLRFAVRFLRRAPGFTVVTILTLVLGIGANAAIFQLLDAVRLRTLAVDHPDQLVEVHAADMTRGRMGHFSGRRPAVTYPLWEQIRDRQRVFSGVFAWGATPLNVGTGGRAHYVQGLWVSGGFFSVLGLHPAAGRLLLPADDQVGCGLSAVVISDAFWQAEYGRDARVIGKALRINDHPVDIVGVAPAGFDGVEIGRTFDVAVPVCAQPNLESDTGQLHDRGWWWLAVMGRLKPGVTIHEASAQLESMSAESFAATAPLAFLPDVRQAYLATKLRAFPAQTGVSTGLREEYSTPLWVLFGMTGFVLVIACATSATSCSSAQPCVSEKWRCGWLSAPHTDALSVNCSSKARCWRLGERPSEPESPWY